MNGQRLAYEANLNADSPRHKIASVPLAGVAPARTKHLFLRQACLLFHHKGVGRFQTCLNRKTVAVFVGDAGVEPTKLPWFQATEGDRSLNPQRAECLTRGSPAARLIPN